MYKEKSQLNNTINRRMDINGIGPDLSFIYRKSVLYSTGQEGYESEKQQEPCNFLLSKFFDTWQLVINYCVRR